MKKRKEGKLNLFSNRLFLKNKRASHVGMILSFVVFITALIFIYTIIEPAVNTPKDKQNILKNLEIQLTDRFSSKLITSMVLNETNPQDYDCLQINNSNINTAASNLDTANLNAIVKNKTGEIVKSKINGDSLQIYWGGKEASFKIYYSEEILSDPSSVLSCINTTSVYYQGLITWKKEVFSSRIIKTIDEYQVNYNSLKTQLKVPSDSEFSFSFKMENTTEIKTQESNVSTGVYSGEFPIQYIDETASIKFGVLKIKVW